jgi:hypothetical protein
MNSSSTNDRKRGSRNLWLWVIIAFMILITAWTTLIVIAAKNQPELIEIQNP